MSNNKRAESDSGKNVHEDVEDSSPVQAVRSVREVMDRIKKEKQIEEEIQLAVVQKLQCGKPPRCT